MGADANRGLTPGPLTFHPCCTLVPVNRLRNLEFDIQALNAQLFGVWSPVSRGHVLEYKEPTSSLLCPYVFVAGPNKHEHFHPS